MMYNNNFAEYSYIFNPNASMSLFERNAYTLLSYLSRNEKKEELEFHVHSKMYKSGEFEYSLKVYVEGIEMPIFKYEVENFNEVYSEDIYEDGILIHHKGKHDQFELVWDGKFFGLDHWLKAEELIEYLKEYSLVD